jgi:hypothetical protein
MSYIFGYLCANLVLLLYWFSVVVSSTVLWHILMLDLLNHWSLYAIAHRLNIPSFSDKIR